MGSDTEPSTDSRGSRGNKRELFFHLEPEWGADQFCDGNSDQICDPDCVETGLPDPDCIVCLGDCNADRRVTIEELIRGVNMALGYLPIEACACFDADTSGRVTINEIVRAVNNAQVGCG